MRARFAVCLGALCTTIAAGCADTVAPASQIIRTTTPPSVTSDTGPNSAGIDTLMHLYVGSKWTYTVIDSVDGPANLTAGVRSFTMQVSGDTIVDGERWSAVDSVGQLEYDDPSPVANYLTNRANGVYIAGAVLTTFSLPPLFPPQVLSNLYLKFPANPGDAAVPPQGTNPPYVLWTVPDTGVVITIPAGSFHCVEIVKPGENAIFYVARGVGVVSVVRLSFSESTPPGPVTSVYRVVKLASYTPGPH